MIQCKIALNEGFDCQNCCLHCDKKETCEDVCDILEKDCSHQVKETDLQVINSAIPEVLQAITHITVQKKRLDEQEKLMKKKLLEAMELFGVKKFENEQVAFTYVPATTRTSIDSDKLKKEHPDIAEQCSKTSPVSASVRIKVK